MFQKNSDMVFMREGWWSSMNRKTVFLLVITMFSVFIPLVSANAPTRVDLFTYQIEGNGVDVPEGYWVYGTFENEAMVHNQREILIEVTLLDTSGTELDVVTAMVRPTIVARDETGSFLAKSTLAGDVAEIKYKLLSSVETDNINFLYLDVSQIVKKADGVEGRFTNTHENQWVLEAEVIASFFDVDGGLVDIQSWGANSFGRFEAGQSETFFITTLEDFETVTLNVQCDRASRYMYPRMIMERPNKVGDSWTPPIGETVILGIQDDPQYAGGAINVLITDPLGNPSTVQFERSGIQDYRYTITPEVPGVWNVTWEWDHFGVDGGYTLVESGVMDAGFFTWDPNAEVNATNTNATSSGIELPVDVDSLIEDTTSSASEIIDSAASSAEDLVDSLPDEVKNKIPGFPISSFVAAFVVVFFLFSRKN